MFLLAGQARDDFQQMRSELQNITEKLNSQVPSREIAKDEGTGKYTFGDSDIQILIHMILIIYKHISRYIRNKVDF